MKHPKELKRILITNRGEIAARIAKAAKELGHTAVGIYTDNEENAPHLEYCEEWIRLSGTSHAETYLNIAKILDLIRFHEIDAVHPGYGFLSENADFADAVTAAGVVFIGPSGKAMRSMGNKALSKAIAKEAKVPVVPGSVGSVATIEEARKIAEEIGFPVLLKAVAGGGGRGMRVCESFKDIETQFEAVIREATSSFGNGELLVEKYIVNPHHIEVQILADRKGNVFHVFERECSIQRRHQKIIEEAPSPFIGEDETLRQNICSTAVKLAKAVNYDSAGTVEFIMGEDRSFYFLEMNTRIQVEHPITEEITGIDLLTCMIEAAFGEDYGIKKQEEIKHFGSAIECRICAEDPITMLPSPGLVTGVETTFPQGIRFDNCLYQGLEITPSFDPMVGKLIAKGMNRQVALRKMRAALDGLIITGLKTNIPLHKEILKNEGFIKGHYSTNFIKEENPQKNIDTSVDFLEIIKQLSGIEAKIMGLR